MKLALLLLLLPFITHSQNQYIEKVVEHRKEKNAEYKDTLKSPFHKEQIANFDSLNYFAPNQKFNIQAKFVKELGAAFDMTTSSGKSKKFRVYGNLFFSIDSIDYVLPIYQNLKLMTNPLYQNYIFIPFTDLTNGEETYGGGRYIEATIPTSNTFNLDFNYCFNPYCHYTTGYNCPIPPKENFLDLRIEAGEKVYEEH
jgi:uncharacterized protein